MHREQMKKLATFSNIASYALDLYATENVFALTGSIFDDLKHTFGITTIRFCKVLLRKSFNVPACTGRTLKVTSFTSLGFRTRYFKKTFLQTCKDIILFNMSIYIT